MAYDEIARKFGGKWKVYRSENFEAFLQVAGVNFFLRKIASKVSPQMEITVAEDKVNITMKTGFISDVSDFAIDEEFMKKFQGHWMKAQPSYEDGKITKMTPIDPHSSMSPHTLQRELVEDEVVLTMIIGDVTCKRFFKKIG